MQILSNNPEIQSYSNAEGDFISGFLIGTKLNDANWKINKETGHDLIRQFEGTDFAIIPELIKTPLSKGGGGHYFGQDTLEDLLKGYGDNSHGKYHKVLGPYSYNDGTDDYYYNAIIKLRDSKAASELVKHGKQTWVPYSISPHIWPLEGNDDDIKRWKPVGGALVIKGAYGPQAVISKLCKGTAAACEKSLGGSHRHQEIGLILNEIARPEPKLCEKKDAELAETISSFCSKSASTQISMVESKADTATPNTPVVTTLSTAAEVAKPNSNPTVNAQDAITSAQLPTKVVTPEQFAEEKKRNAELEKQVKQLLEDKKVNTLNTMFGKIKDEKVREELVKEFTKRENVDELKQFLDRVYPILRASEQDEEEKDKDNGDQPPTAKAKSKGASSLPKEPELPKEDNTAESKAASVPVNKLREILRYQMSGGRA